jgi:hypothetical protein
MRECPIACCAGCHTPFTWDQFQALRLDSDEGEQPERRACRRYGVHVYLDTRGLGPAMFLEHDDGEPFFGPRPSIEAAHHQHKRSEARPSVAWRALLVVALLLWCGMVGWLLWRGWWSR